MPPPSCRERSLQCENERKKRNLSSYYREISLLSFVEKDISYAKARGTKEISLLERDLSLLL